MKRSGVHSNALRSPHSVGDARVCWLSWWCWHDGCEWCINGLWCEMALSASRALHGRGAGCQSFYWHTCYHGLTEWLPCSVVCTCCCGLWLRQVCCGRCVTDGRLIVSGGRFGLYIQCAESFAVCATKGVKWQSVWCDGPELSRSISADR